MSKHLMTNHILLLKCEMLCAHLSIGPASDELHHPISIQVKGVDAHCMILRLKGERKKTFSKRKWRRITFKAWVFVKKKKSLKSRVNQLTSMLM